MRTLIDKINYYELNKKNLRCAVGEKLNLERLLMNLLPPEHIEEKKLIPLSIPVLVVSKPLSALGGGLWGSLISLALR